MTKYTKGAIWHAIRSSKYAIISSCKIFSCTRFQVIEISFLMFFGDFGILRKRNPKKKPKERKPKQKVGGGRGGNSGKTKVCSICSFKSWKKDFELKNFWVVLSWECRRWVGWWEFDMGGIYQAAYLHACRLLFWGLHINNISISCLVCVLFPRGYILLHDDMIVAQFLLFLFLPLAADENSWKGLMRDIIIKVKAPPSFDFEVIVVIKCFGLVWLCFVLKDSFNCSNKKCT